MFDVEALAALIETKVRQAVRDELAKVPPPGPEYVTIAEAAALVSVHPSTIGAWFREGRLKRHGKGRVVRVKRVELLAAMEMNRASKPRESGKEIAERLLKKAAH